MPTWALVPLPLHSVPGPTSSSPGGVWDSALALGPLIHEFGWGPHDLDALAQGSLAGHLLECGPQSTGGLLTDWEDVPSWDDIGYPMAECRADGSFILTKPEGTGGLVDVSHRIRTADLRDRRSCCVPVARRDLRLATRRVDPGRSRPRRGQGIAGTCAATDAQSLRPGRGRLQDHGVGLDRRP